MHTSESRLLFFESRQKKINFVDNWCAVNFLLFVNQYSVLIKTTIKKFIEIRFPKLLIIMTIIMDIKVLLNS